MLISRWYTATLTFGTDDQNTAEVNLYDAFEAIEIDIPTIESAEIQIKGANKTGETFDLIGQEEPIPASLGGFRTTVPLGGKYQFIKVYLSVAQTSNRVFSVRGISYASGGLVGLIDRIKQLLTGIVLSAGSEVIGKVRLVSTDGTEVTDDTASAIKSTIVDATGTDAIGAVTASPVSNTLLDRLKALLTGIVLAAGTNIVGWFKIKRVPVITPTTGTSTALATLNPGADYHMLGIRVHISTGAPLAAAETLTVILDANAGVAYDVVLFTLDMGTPDIRDVVIPFGGDEDFFVSGDEIVIALSANAGGDTWGCETIHELV